MPHFYPLGITLTYEGKLYRGRVGIVGSYYYSEAVVPEEFSVFLRYQEAGRNAYTDAGRIKYTAEGWRSNDPEVPQELIDIIGEYIMLWYE